MNWPEEVKDPSKLSNFETLARRLRYQTLGKACRAEDIRTLFLGHHSDDNVETALIRLSQGHGRFGLAGFDSVSPIPECQGLWGVSQSGDITSVDATRSKNETPQLPVKTQTQHFSPEREPNHDIATGGVYIFRPFQSFQKARLEATCYAAGVPFVVDPTNADHTLTIRNTVRHLLASGSLPRALQRESMLAMINRNQGAKKRLQQLADRFLEKIKVLSFDLKTGALLVKLSLPEELRLFEQTYNRLEEEHPYIDPFDVRVKVVRILIDLVSPELNSQLSHSALSTTARTLWPNSPNDTASSETFTLGGVHFQPQECKSKEGGCEGLLHGYKKCSQAALVTIPFFAPGPKPSDKSAKISNGKFADPNIWLLSREPFRRSLAGPVTHFEVPLPASFQSPTSGQATKVGHEERNTGEWTEWKLWDGRYWIRLRAALQNKLILLKPDMTPKVHIYTLGDAIPIAVEPIIQEDISTIRQNEAQSRYFRRWYSWKITEQDLGHGEFPIIRESTNSRWTRKAFDVLLACFAPGHVRRTIPVLWHSYTTQESALPAKPSSALSKENLLDFHNIINPTNPPLSKEAIAKIIASFPSKDHVSENEPDNEAKYGNGEYEDEQFFNINDTQRLIAVPTFGRRIGTKIWVRVPSASVQHLSADGLKHCEQESKVEYICPWIIEWEIVYKHLDPATIRNLGWGSQP